MSLMKGLGRLMTNISSGKGIFSSRKEQTPVGSFAGRGVFLFILLHRVKGVVKYAICNRSCNGGTAMKRGEIWTLRDRQYASKARPVIVIQNDAYDNFDSVMGIYAEACLSRITDKKHAYRLEIYELGYGKI